MITTRRTIRAACLALALLLLSSDLLAQRGRYYRGSYRGYYPRYVPARAFAFHSPFMSVHFGGNYYRYQHGFFYRPFGTTFSIVVPPVGIRIARLPVGYRRVYVGPNPYYYYNGIYYRSLPNRQYEVVTPPLGAEVDRLPPGARVTVINGHKYYELNGTFYEEHITPENELYYEVVGTDGVLNTTTNDEPDSQDDHAASDTVDTERIPAGPLMGDRLENLPADAKEVVINGMKYYTTPAGYYYREVIDGNKVLYEVVGK